MSSRSDIAWRPGVGGLGGRRAFSLIELLIVIAILGIIGALVVPNLSDASAMARANTLKDELRYLRTQLAVFKAQHRDTPPGYPGGDMSQPPSEAVFLEQMTRATDEYCRIGAPSRQYCFGPYLSRMPANPLNGLRTIHIVPNGAPMPPPGMPDNSTGWIYKPQTLEILANSPGVDVDGIRYIDY